MWFKALPGGGWALLSRPSGQVNATLDCDTSGACFEYTASILVIDDGQPLMTSK